MLLARAPGGRSATLGFRPLASVVHPLGLPLTFPRRRFSSGRCVVLCRATSVRTTGHTGRTGPDRTNGAAKVRCPGEGAPPMECSCHARAAAQRPTDESIDRRRGTLARNSFRVDHVTNGSADAAPLFPAPLTGADRRGAARRVCSPLRALRSFSRCCVTRRPLRNDRHCRCCCATVRQPADAARR